MNDPSVESHAAESLTRPRIAVVDALAILQDLEAIVWESAADTSAFTFVSKGAERLLGYPVESWLVPGFWAAHLHPDDHEWVDASYQEARRLGHNQVLEYRMLAADGREVWLRDHARYSGSHSPALRSHGVIVDISREKSADQQLREHRDFNATVLDNIEALVALLDPDGTLCRVNRTCERTLGRSSKSIVGRRFEERFACEGEMGAVTAQFARLAAGRARAHCETHILRRDGEARKVMWAFTAVRDEAGQLTRMVATGVDVSDREQAQEQLRQRESELLHAQKMDALGRLAGGVAHDFNNVITAILGYAHVLESELHDRPDTRAMAEGIREAAEHATRLTSQLRTLSRKQDAALGALSPARELTGMREMLARLIGEDILLELEISSDGDSIQGEPGQFTQLLLNLALNARDAMPQGGTLVLRLDRVTLCDEERARRQLPGEVVRLAVQDDGSGMEEGTRTRAFEPFFTTKGQGGTGLGLSTVYGIVRAWGGDISLESAPGRGTTFQLLFPRVGAVEPVANPAVRESTSSRSGGGTIMLAEDEPVVRRLMRETLRRAGYEVIAASDGRDAIAKAALHRGPIDLLVTDVVMPGMSGREAAEQMVASRPGLRVLFVSGYTNDAVLRHGVAPEGSDFLEKPFAPELLAQRVRTLLEAAAVSHGLHL